MTTHQIAPHSTHRSKPSRWLWALVLLLIACAVWLGAVPGSMWDGSATTPPATPEQAPRALLSYSAQLTSQSLSDKQRLLDAYANTLGQVDVDDGLSTKKWLNTHGDLVGRLFEETWLVFLPSAPADSPNATGLHSWLLRPGQAAVATPLTAAMANKLADLQNHKLSASLAISYLVEPDAARVVHASPALNKQGAPVAVLIALTPLSAYLSAEGMCRLDSPSGQTPPLAASATMLGPFITNTQRQLLATTTGQDSSALQTLLRTPSADYLLLWQALPGTSWQMGLALPQSALAASTPWAWLKAAGIDPDAASMRWTLTVLCIATALALLAWLMQAFLPRRAQAPASSALPQPRSALAQTSEPFGQLESPTSARPHSARSTNPGLVAARPHTGLSAPLGLPAQAPFNASAAASMLCVAMSEWQHASQCLVLLRHGKIEAMSQGALEFLQLSRQPAQPSSILSLLAQPHDYQRLHLLISAAAHDAAPFSFTVTIVDALGVQHTVFAQAFKPMLHAKHQRLMVFEPLQAKLERQCGCHNPGMAAALAALDTPLDATTCLPTFAYWHLLLQGLLQRHLAQDAGSSTQPDQTKPGWVLYLAIDGFASLSSEGGSAFSDEALRYTANTLTHVLGQLPYPYLLGHIQKEHFALACLGINEQQALQLAKQLQRAIASLQASHQGAPMLQSISVGLVALPVQLSALDAHLSAADLACFDAAAKGLEGLQVATLFPTAAATAS